MDKNVRELHELAKDIRKILDSPVLPSVREIAQSLITDGWHKDIKPSPSEFKVIGDEEIFNIWTDKKNNMQTTAGKSRLIAQAQLTADLKAHASIIAEKDAKIAGLEGRIKGFEQALNSQQQKVAGEIWAEIDKVIQGRDDVLPYVWISDLKEIKAKYKE